MSRIVKALVLGLVVSLTGVVGTSADGLGTVKLTGYGGDSCTAPSTSQMQAFWSNTRFSYWGVYIGGVDRGCSQPNLTASWVTAVTNQGWDLLPFWVGPQSPCYGGSHTFSLDPATAYDQGKAEALAAYKAWRTISSVTDVPIDYDLEGPSNNTTACRTAAKSFINGWVAQLHVAPAQPAGVYTSACAGAIDDFSTIASPPDFIDAADWDGDPSTGNVSCVASSHWTNLQRHKQYQGGHNETWNGVTLNIDSRCSNGHVFGAANHTSTTQACAPHAALSPSVSRAVRQSDAATSWHGVQWRAGGPLDSQLQVRRPGDSGWESVPMTALTRRTTNVPVSAATVGQPAVLSDGSLLVPVTSHRQGRSRLSYYTSKDGRTFAKRGERTLSTHLAPGVAASTAVAGDHVLSVDPASLRTSTWAPGISSAVSNDFAPTGLSAPQWLHFADSRHGTALVAPAGCSAAAKSSCGVVPRLLHTDDGGHTWHR